MAWPGLNRGPFRSVKGLLVTAALIVLAVVVVVVLLVSVLIYNGLVRRRGVYPVEVTVVWVAEAFLDGARVGEVDDLVSRAAMSYPVAELRTVLTG